MRKGFTLIELMIVIAIIAIIAAIAVPNLLESRVTANESAASASLKSTLFPNEVSFQGGAYQDADLDNVGEYGTIEAMGGLIVTTKITQVGSLRLVTGPLVSNVPLGVAGVRVTSGYNFMTAIPAQNAADGTTTGATVEGNGMPLALAAPAGFEFNNAERSFIAGCAPDRFGDTGRRVFCLTQDGQVRSPTLPANSNTWFAVSPPINGTATTVVSITAGLTDFIGAAPATATPGQWTTPLGTTRVGAAPPTYPTYTK